MAKGVKTGGRQKGSKNKRTRVLTIGSVSERLQQLGCDPVAICVEIANNEGNSAMLRGRMAAELLQYLFPKLRSIEHSGLGGAAIEVNVSGLDLLNSRISRIAERRRESGSPQRVNGSAGPSTPV